MDSRLAELYTSCHSHFQELLSAVRSPKRDIGDQMPPKHVESELDKLILWANNVGAVYTGDSYEFSLDYRLRDSPFYQERVSSFLNSLNRWLVRATQIVQNEATPFEELVDLDLDVESIDSVMSSDTDSETDSDADSDSSGEQGGKQIRRHSEESDLSASAESNPLELPKTLELIRFIINCLYKMPIRRPAALERITDRIREKFASYQQYDARFVQDLHPELDPTIATRLGRLISLRRHILYYQEEHNAKLQPEPIQRGLLAGLVVGTQSKANAVVYTTPPSEQASGVSRPSKATTHLNPPDRPDLQKFDFPPSVASSHHSRASTYAINSIGLPLPPMPKNADGTPLTHFLCPYCKITQYIQTERSWKKHLLRDLKPYVCTFSGCSFQDHFFASRDAWYLHETQEHRCEWHCNVEGHDICKTQEHFMNHMSESHGTELSWDQMANLAPMFRRAQRSSAGRCNLCNRKSESLCDHVARHLERIALFALPRASPDDADSTFPKSQQSLEALHSDNGSLSASAELDSSDEASVSQSTSQSFGGNAERFLFEDEAKLSKVSQNLVPDSDDIGWDVVTTQLSVMPDAMRNRPSSSVLRTSVSIPRKAQCEELAQKLHDAVKRTTKDVAEDDVQRSAFLPKPELDQILNDRSLELLFTELVSGNTSFRGGAFLQIRAISIADEEKGSDSIRDDIFINSCIDATKRKPLDEPSWRALLALFLYQNNKELLSLFLEWMAIMFNHPTAKSDNLIPSDESIPFTKATLQEYNVPYWCHRLILLDQAIFKPIMIKKLGHHDITASERLPFIGRYHPIKNGSQGQVFKAEIAPGHWEIQVDEDQEGSNFVAGNPKSTKVVALKVFKASGTAHNMLEATLDFDIELIILNELRTYRTMHKMIMLHLGSITELDGARHPLKHSLIFELASFSLGDLLKDRNRPQKTVTHCRLLASLVDIVEALECLHDKLETLHLDIKPDNILIFENYSGSDKQYELIWKLSDFGLARKKEAKQLAASKQTSTATSRASTLPATRPAGLYQAPEIQEQETSQAGRGSDVWSMGCVALMVLAFGYAGPKEVDDLERSLMVRFMNLGGREPLFYIRSDSYSWQHRTSHICHYLQNRDPDVGLIPRTAGPLRAALHPGLIDWSNFLVEESYAFRKEQKFVIYILRVIVGSVLLIDRSKRMRAFELRGKLAYIQREWEKHDLAPDNYVHADALAELCFTRSRRSQGFETSPPGQSDESSPVRVPHLSTDLPTATTDSRATLRDQSEVTLHPIPSIESSVPDVPSQLHEPIQAQSGTPAPLVERKAPQHQRGLTPDLTPQIQEELCCAIEQNDATKVRLQLEQNPGMLGQLLPGAKRYPIHWAIFNNAYQALDALLDKASLEITNLPWNGRTALDLALDSGKPAALDCIRKHRDKFAFPHELYDMRKRHLGSEAKRIAGDLFDINEAATPRQRSFFGLRRSRTSNAST